MYTNTSENTDSISKWKEDIYNSQAARMDWSIKSKRNDVNHFPVAVLNGDKTRKILELTVKPGETVSLDASGSSDPDGDSLEYSWQFYAEPSSYDGALEINDAAMQSTNVLVPSKASGKTIHLILVVRDKASPSLAAYRRLILNVN